ncbi:hypothetical protein O2604_17235 [Pseudomonas aeruginosa]|uniref:hypothetical protein n=1 Tax=Pseudomonas aeruginosa TaxID=287 RepID=UPI0022B048C2|nr:hypothetical protein [Pseudomonas aeruginosa]WAW38806.1 hypothetical protein O2604_17235 [Pseudomonas aeruginosa]
MPDMREEFDAWHHAEFGYCVPEEEDPLAIGECVKRWRIWQASRAALRVELPEKIGPHNMVGRHVLPEAAGYDDAIDDCREALQQAGIEVK